MTKGQRTIATLLAVIAALLAAHLLVRLGDQEAQAQQGQPFAEPTVVAGQTSLDNDPFPLYRTWRWWSDGTVDVSVSTFSQDTSCDFAKFGAQCGPEVIIDPGP